MKIENGRLTIVEIADIHNDTIDIPKTCESISTFAFDKMEELIHTIIIPSTVKEIDPTTFTEFKNLYSCVFQNDVCKFGRSLFANCKNLTIVKLPDYLTKIPINCFENCVSLRQIHIPDKVREITIAQFKGCINLDTIYWKDKIYSYDDLKEYKIFK